MRAVVARERGRGGARPGPRAVRRDAGPRHRRAGRSCSRCRPGPRPSGSPPTCAEFLGADAVELFPAWETLPFERVSPAIETMGRRLRVIWRLRHAERRRDAAGRWSSSRRCARSCSGSVRTSRTSSPSSSRAGDRVDRDELVERLVDDGLPARVPGRGAGRGRGARRDRRRVPVTADHPVRIDLWGDEVDRLSQFSVADQRSTTSSPTRAIFPVRELLPDRRGARARRRARHGRSRGARSSGSASPRARPSTAWSRGCRGSRPTSTCCPTCSARRRSSLLRRAAAAARPRAGAARRGGRARRQRSRRRGARRRRRRRAAPVAAVRPAARAHEGAGACRCSPRPTGPTRRCSPRARSIRSSATPTRWRSGSRGCAPTGYRVFIAAEGTRLGRPHRADARRRGRVVDRRRDPGARRRARTPGVHIVVAPLDRGAVVPGRAARARRRGRPHRSPARAPPAARRAQRRRLLRRSRRRRLRRAPRARRRPLRRHGDRGDVRRRTRLPARRVQGRRPRLRRPRTSGSSASTPAARRRSSRRWAAPTGRRRGARARRGARHRGRARRALPAPARDARPRVRAPTRRSSTRSRRRSPTRRRPIRRRRSIETKADMERPIPMDRLVCGDVGYGKTEVALRAAAKAVFDGKQVAILVPTTLLASQHGQTFRERFANYPVRVEVLSRFLSAKEQTEVVRGRRGRHRRHRDRHAPAALRRHHVQGPRPARRRRGAALRRAAQGADQGDARRASTCSRSPRRRSRARSRCRSPASATSRS